MTATATKTRKKRPSPAPGKSRAAPAASNRVVAEKSSRQPDPKAFARILDEVVRDYATTLRNLA